MCQFSKIPHCARSVPGGHPFKSFLCLVVKVRYLLRSTSEISFVYLLYLSNTALALWPEIFIATLSGIPALIMFRSVLFNHNNSWRLGFKRSMFFSIHIVRTYPVLRVLAIFPHLIKIGDIVSFASFAYQ